MDKKGKEGCQPVTDGIFQRLCAKSQFLRPNPNPRKRREMIATRKGGGHFSVENQSKGKVDCV